ncbi:hypothetical protein D3C75_1090790 [compost metagenome]
MVSAGFLNQFVPPQVTAFVPFDITAGTFKHDNVFDSFNSRVFERVIDVFLQRNGAPGTNAFVGGNHQFRAGVDDAPGNGFR